MAIAIMRITHLRQADLNLLVVFTALAEERSVTRAASRLLLSQPAVSRALQRLREMFHDDLLIRTSSGYEQTLRESACCGSWQPPCRGWIDSLAAMISLRRRRRRLSVSR
jgi:hypothetical protein